MYKVLLTMIMVLSMLDTSASSIQSGKKIKTRATLPKDSGNAPVPTNNRPSAPPLPPWPGAFPSKAAPTLSPVPVSTSKQFLNAAEKESAQIVPSSGQPGKRMKTRAALPKDSGNTPAPTNNKSSAPPLPPLPGTSDSKAASTLPSASEDISRTFARQAFDKGLERILLAPNPIVLALDDSNTIGIKLSLPPDLQSPLISFKFTTDTLLKFLLQTPQKVLETREVDSGWVSADYGPFAWKERLFFAAPFWAFNECPCIPRYIRSEFASAVVQKAVALYMSKKQGPFIYGSFAPGDLFSDLFTLTLFISELRKQKVNGIHIRLNLIDIAFFNYKTELKKLYYKLNQTGVPLKIPEALNAPTRPAEEWEASYEDTTYRLVTLLRWLTQNLGVKIDLYLYATAQEYLRDIEQGRNEQNDLLLAVDFWGERDVPQAIALGVSLGGYCASLFRDLEFEDEHGRVSETAGAGFVISQKIEEISAEQITELLKKVRGDTAKLHRLFYPIMYEQLAPVQRSFYGKAKNSLEFDPMDYFQIVARKHYVYEDLRSGDVTELSNAKKL